MKIENEYLKKILKKQCEIVGADYVKIDFKKEGWFTDYTWTEKQEDEFYDWLIEFLKDRKAWKSLTSHWASYNKKNREKLAGEWILNYGWKLK